VATKAQVEKAIFEREGFRVELQLFDGKRPSLPPYDYPVMAPQRWKFSDWKNARLEAYRLLVKGATIYLGGSEPTSRDMQLGNQRDSYYEDAYGSLEPPQEVDVSKVVPLDSKRPEEAASFRKRPR
jgi:hypothetical protein